VNEILLPAPLPEKSAEGSRGHSRDQDCSHCKCLQTHSTTSKMHHRITCYRGYCLCLKAWIIRLVLGRLSPTEHLLT